MNKNLLLATLLIIVSTYIFANNNTPNNNAGQSFIVTNTNDTLFGAVQVQIEENTATVTFTNNEGESKSYEPFQIKGYADKGTFFESKLYNLSKEFDYGYNVFMERKADGVAKVYHFTENDKTRVFIEKEDGKMTEVNGTNFRTEMSKFFDNCPPLKAKILRGVYKKKDVNQIVADYNKWKTKG